MSAYGKEGLPGYQTLPPDSSPTASLAFLLGTWFIVVGCGDWTCGGGSGSAGRWVRIVEAVARRWEHRAPAVRWDDRTLGRKEGKEKNEGEVCTSVLAIVRKSVRINVNINDCDFNSCHTISHGLHPRRKYSHEKQSRSHQQVVRRVLLPHTSPAPFLPVALSVCGPCPEGDEEVRVLKGVQLLHKAVVGSGRRPCLVYMRQRRVRPHAHCHHDIRRRQRGCDGWEVG